MRTASCVCLFALFILVGGLSACNRPSAGDETQTPDITQAYQTVQARLTQAAPTTAVASPTLQPSATMQPTTTSPISAIQPSATQAPPQPTAATKLCDQAAPGVPIDVTIPDDTIMAPGQTFTKTWRLQNTGACTWTTDYSIAVFSGEPMGTTTGVQMPRAIAPGESLDISVDLTAPTTPATYQGNWKLRNASGAWFGIGPNGNSPFWVKIVVSGTPAAATGTVTPTITTTPGTPYPSDDPAPAVSGSAVMVPGDVINLDANQVNAGGGDLTFEGSEERLRLVPMGSALFTVFGNATPRYADCASAALTNLPLRLRNLTANMVICYRTDTGLYGYMRLATFDPENNNTLGFNVLTWSKP